MAAGTSAARPGSCSLMNIASFQRTTAPLMLSQLNIRPVFRRGGRCAGKGFEFGQWPSTLTASSQRTGPARRRAPSRSPLSGQIETMRESYAGLFAGIALAVVLVYLFLVINFQSWIDPVIVLLAVPFALGGA